MGGEDTMKHPAALDSTAMPGKTAVKKKRATRKAKPKTKGLDAPECKVDIYDEPIREVLGRIDKEGGTMDGYWKDQMDRSQLVHSYVPNDTHETAQYQRE